MVTAAAFDYALPVVQAWAVVQSHVRRGSSRC